MVVSDGLRVYLPGGGTLSAGGWGAACWGECNLLLLKGEHLMLVLRENTRIRQGASKVLYIIATVV